MSAFDKEYLSAGGPAYPIEIKSDEGDFTFGGLSVLDAFAIAALPTCLTACKIGTPIFDKRVAVKLAFDIAKEALSHRST